MQNVKFYVAAPQTLGAVRDYANAKNASAPTLVRGCGVCLQMRLFANADGDAAYPLAQLSNIVSWQWAMDKDFNEATSYILEADNSDITVATVTDTVDGTDIDYTEISIPISDMNTEELAAWLGTEKSKVGLAGELVGFDADSKQVFVLQVENFTVRNRITSLGTPTPISPDYLTAAQVRSLIAAGIAVRYSANGSTDWHDTQTDADRYICVRSASDANAAWSEAIALVVGPTGAKGDDSYCYTAYASDSVGTGFSLTPTNALKYRAEIHSTIAIPNPTAEDFSDVVWVKYIGDDGTGAGDMMKSVYDPDDDGKVNSADEADHAASADAVPWSGVSGKPTTFAPGSHAHEMIDIANPVQQLVHSEFNPKTLYLNRPIVRKTNTNSSGTIELEFTSIMDKVGGSNREVGDSEILTWEYHVPCGADVTGVSVGSVNCSMIGINIPETLELINSNVTVHVFVIRAVYKSGAVNNVRYQANYAYSYEA